MNWLLGVLAGVVLLVVVVMVVGLVQLRREPKPVLETNKAHLAYQAPPDRSELARRVAELEAQLPSVARQVRELDDATSAQLRKLWGAVSVDRRADRQGKAAQLPLLADEDDQADGVRALTPALLAQLTGGGSVVAEAEQTMKPARRRTWGRS